MKPLEKFKRQINRFQIFVEVAGAASLESPSFPSDRPFKPLDGSFRGPQNLYIIRVGKTQNQDEKPPQDKGDTTKEEKETKEEVEVDD